MTTNFLINSGVQSNQEIRFLLTNTSLESIGTPSGKMITDSKQLTFVYLLDETNDYRHIHFPQAVWPLMATALGSDKDPELSWNDQIITLTGFREELEMLIFNIEGNHNYGESFTSAVERVFAKQLQGIE